MKLNIFENIYFTEYYCQSEYNTLLPVLIVCTICGGGILNKMSVVPQAMLVVRKVRQNDEKMHQFHEKCDLSPTKYSSKYMNSIWGMYNRYSVHNLKKNMDEDIFAFTGAHKEPVGPHIKSVERSSTDFKGSLKSAHSFFPTLGFI